jgi:hypothetical protein
VSIAQDVDTNRNGHLERSEVRSALSKLGRPPTDAEADRLFRRLDLNSDGTVDFGEFRHALVLHDGDDQLRRWAFEAVAAADVGDGQLLIPAADQAADDSAAVLTAAARGADTKSDASAAASSAAASAGGAPSGAVAGAAANWRDSAWWRTFREFMAGGLAGAISRSAVAPLERIKILYMCGDPSLRGLGVAGTLRKIWREDGLKGFFRGNGQSRGRCALTVAVC